VKNSNQSNGFTIIEVLVVLAVAATILLLVFVAVPQLQRNVRNNKRKADAALILNAIGQCVTNHNLDRNQCKTPASLPLTVSELSIYTGYHYGSTGPSNNLTQVPPTNDEPNWLFGLNCGTNGNLFNNIGTTSGVVVTFFIETPSGWGTQSECDDGI
jgi:prepilin-type N-terminal cleavage/methylation domain-containing protein